MPRAHFGDEFVEVLDHPVHPVDQRALAAGLAVAAVIDGVERVSLRHQSFYKVAVAPAVLGITVRDNDHVARFALGQPALREQLDPAVAGQVPEGVLHPNLPRLGPR